MKRRSMWPVLLVGVATLLNLPNQLHANTFCNMDQAGGEKGRKAQEKSARAAAIFFQAASTTFQMFGQVELHLAGDKTALKRASDLSSQSREQLATALTAFDGVRLEADAIKSIDDALKQVTDYSIALKEAKVSPTSPIATSVLEALKKGSLGVLQVCAQSIKDLQDSDKAMGKVYNQVGRSVIPSSQDLWDAIVEWNEALIRGRLISSIFKVRKK
jgi:hypothetical protein